MNKLSIYIHWPFCLAKCPYCDFNSHVASAINHQEWLEAYLVELNHFAPIIKGRYIKSIFFGGGTPSLMKPFIVEKIINKISNWGKIDCSTEITLEANPTSFETEKFREFKYAGINRVSIGVQALREDALKKLGRQHNVSQAKHAIESASKIFEKCSFDLIYARSGQTLLNWQEELEEAINFAKGHISLYQLTIEKGTPFFKLFKEGQLILPDNDLAADMYEWTTCYLEAKRYERYEISNYATKNNECQHNLTYWNYEDYLGIGPGAHSRLKNFKIDVNTQPFFNSIISLMMWHKPDKWMKIVNETGQGVQIKKQLSTQEIIEEFLMMGLRLKQGVCLKTLERLVNINIEDIINYETALHFSNIGLVNLSSNNICLTSKGLMLHNYLVPLLIR